MLLGAVAIGDDRLETSAILGKDQRADILSHEPSVAHLAQDVNPLFVSLH